MDILDGEKNVAISLSDAYPDTRRNDGQGSTKKPAPHSAGPISAAMENVSA
jgi:hypothetical protein